MRKKKDGKIQRRKYVQIDNFSLFVLHFGGFIEVLEVDDGLGTTEFLRWAGLSSLDSRWGVKSGASHFVPEVDGLCGSCDLLCRARCGRGRNRCLFVALTYHTALRGAWI